MSEYSHSRSRHRWLWGLGSVLAILLVAGGTALFSAVRQARINAERSNDRGYLCQLAVAVHNYHDNYGQLPPPYIADASGRPMHSWRVLLLPYLGDESRDLYQQYHFDEPWDGPNNRKLARRMPDAYALHGLEMQGNTTTNHLAVVGRETVWNPKSKVTLDDVQDAHRNTILIVENYGSGIHWMEPRDLSFHDMDFTVSSPRGVSTWHGDPAVVALDGGTKWLGKEITPATLRALLTVNGGEQIQESDSRNWLPLAEKK